MKQHTAEAWIRRIKQHGWQFAGKPAPFPGKHPTRLVLWIEERKTKIVRFNGLVTNVAYYVPVFIYFGKPSPTKIRAFVDKHERVPFGARTYAFEVDRKNFVLGYSATGPAMRGVIRQRGYALNPTWRNDDITYAYHPLDTNGRMLGQYQLPQFVKRIGGWTFRSPKEKLSLTLEVNPIKEWLAARGYIKNEQRTAKARV